MDEISSDFSLRVDVDGTVYVKNAEGVERYATDVEARLWLLLQGITKIKMELIDAQQAAQAVAVIIKAPPGVGSDEAVTDYVKALSLTKKFGPIPVIFMRDDEDLELLSPERKCELLQELNIYDHE